MDTSLSIGLSALLAAQKALDTTGHNLANVHTPNFSRQRTITASIPPSRVTALETGRGVATVRVDAVRDQFIDRILLARDPASGAATRRSELLSEIESLFSVDPETSLGAIIDELFNSFRELARNPSGSAERGGVVHQAQTVAIAFNDLAEHLDRLRRELLPATQEVVAKINALAEQVASLNLQIRDCRVNGGEANDLVDQRLTALRDLAQLIPIDVTYDYLDRADVRAAGFLLVANDDTTELAANADDGLCQITVGDSSVPYAPGGGQLGAILDVANAVLPDYLDCLDTLAATIAREVNQRHATGVGHSGSFASIVSTNPVADALAPLNQCRLPFQLQSGHLQVSVIDQTTGEVTQSKLAIHPNTDSLTDLAAALDGVDHLSAQVADGYLQIAGASGYAFDFANKVVTHPGSLGTAAVTLEGNVQLDATDTYTFTADATGTIGTTAGLTVTVTDSTGATVAVLDVGEGYQPGQALSLRGGISVSFGAGDIDATAPDTVAVELVADPDAQGFLAALGINTLFGGSDAASLRVRPEVAADPERVAAGRSDDGGDNANALRLADIQDEALAALGSETVDGYYAAFIGRVGLDAQMAQTGERTATLLLDAAQNQRDAISAVNQDEEAVNLLRYQQLYAFAARYVRSVEELTDELMQIL